jgi:hypothetical protein
MVLGKLSCTFCGAIMMTRFVLVVVYVLGPQEKDRGSGGRKSPWDLSRVSRLGGYAAMAVLLLLRCDNFLAMGKVCVGF